MTQLNIVHNIIPHFPKVYFNIIFLSASGPPKQYLLMRLIEQNVVMYSRCLASFYLKNATICLIIQSVQGGKVNIVGGRSIGHSKQKIVYVRASYSKRFPR
jgi:hypothetical protein